MQTLRQKVTIETSTGKAVLAFAENTITVTTQNTKTGERNARTIVDPTGAISRAVGTLIDAVKGAI